MQSLGSLQNPVASAATQPSDDRWEDTAGKFKRWFKTCKEWLVSRFPSLKEVVGEEEDKEEFLLHLGDGDFLTKTNVFEGVQIFGATGSGKTTGSGQHLAMALINHGFGGLVLTVKADELATWRRYLANADSPRREGVDFFVLEPGGRYTFNFLKYEQEVAARKGLNLTDNLVALFCAVMEVSQRGSGGGEEAYWNRTVRQLMRNAIDLLLLAKIPLNFQNISTIISSAPTHLSYVVNKEDASCVRWREESACWRCVAAVEKAISEGAKGYSDAQVTLRYWKSEFPSLAEETRSIIVSYFTSMADCFLRGVLRDLFSPNPTKAEEEGREELNPDRTHEGKIIILNLPVKQLNELGQFAQVLYKFVWQRATERRDPDAAGQTPVFLWADEAQFFVNSHDMLFQTTARASRAATIYLTQNISNYYAIMPGDKGRAETDSLLGNFQTKIFHAQGDSVTNLWAADLIGKKWNFRENHSSSVSTRDGAGTSQFGSSVNQTLDHQVLPMQFTTLKKGGKDNAFEVQAYIFQAGRSWATGENFKAIDFEQEFLPDPPTDDDPAHY